MIGLTCNISETMQDRTKVTMTDSYPRFRLVLKSMTFDDLEWPTRTIAEKKVYGAHRKKFE